MKKILIFISCITLILLSAQFIRAREVFYYYDVEIDYHQGRMDINSVEIKFSEKEIENDFGLYSVEIVDKDEKILNITFFDVPNKILYDTVNPKTGLIEGGGEIELENVSFSIYVPYYENAKEIIIYNEDLEERIRKDVSEYSKERAIKESEGLEEDFRKDSERKIIDYSKEKSFIENLNEYWWVLVIALAVLIIVLFFSLKEKKEKK